MNDPWFFQRWAHQQRVGNPTRKLILTSLASMAESNTGYCRPSQALLAEYAECDERTVRRHARDLESAGLVARRHRHGEGRRLADEYVLLAPGIATWPDGVPCQPDNLTASQPVDMSASVGESTGPIVPLTTESTGQPTSTQPDTAMSGELPEERPVSEAKASNGRARQRKPSRKVDQTEPPLSLPGELHHAAHLALQILRGVWEQRGGLEPTIRGVGLAVEAYPDRDHAAVARNVEYWLTAGNGRNAGCGDIAARFRSFLTSSPPASHPAPSDSNVRPFQRPAVRAANRFLDAPEYRGAS